MLRHLIFRCKSKGCDKKLQEHKASISLICFWLAFVSGFSEITLS